MENQKVKDEDIKLIKDIRLEFQQVALKIGQLDLRIKDLEVQKNELWEEYSKLKNKEKEIANKFIEKYGEGQLNPNTWTFDKKQ